MNELILALSMTVSVQDYVTYMPQAYALISSPRSNDMYDDALLAAHPWPRKLAFYLSVASRTLELLTPASVSSHEAPDYYICNGKWTMHLNYLRDLYEECRYLPSVKEIDAFPAFKIPAHESLHTMFGRWRHLNRCLYYALVEKRNKFLPGHHFYNQLDDILKECDELWKIYNKLEDAKLSSTMRDRRHAIQWLKNHPWISPQSFRSGVMIPCVPTWRFPYEQIKKLTGALP